MKTTLQFSVQALVVKLLIHALICFSLCTLTSIKLYAQSNTLIFTDDTFNPQDWTVHEFSEHGASQSYTQALSGGHPGAFRSMQHILPAPAGDLDLTTMGTFHIYQGDSYDPSKGPITYIDYSEDMRLLSLPIPDAFITSTLALEQDGVLYYSHWFYNGYIEGDTTWHSKSSTGQVADDFIPILEPESSRRPDFSETGSPIKFGYYRYSYRSQSYPEYPLNQDLVVDHAIDNWRVELHGNLENRPPVANDNNYVVTVGEMRIFPLENDFDPNGDPLRIYQVSDPRFHGEIVSWDSVSILYKPALFEGWWSDKPVPDFDQFTYVITDISTPVSFKCADIDSPGSLFGTGIIFFEDCDCWLERLFFGVCWNQPYLQKILITTATPDSIDLGLFYQFRDDVLLQHERGDTTIAKYYQHSHELIQLVALDRTDFRKQAIKTVYMLQEPIYSLVNGDSSSVISQTLVDTLSAFLDSLSALASPDLRQSLQEEMDKWGPLDDYVGKSVKDAVTDIFGGVVTGIKSTKSQPAHYSLGQNYPNPFNTSTTLSYVLPGESDIDIQVYNVLGKEIHTLYQGKQQAGQHRCSWDGTDNAGMTVSSGVYLIVLKTGNMHLTRKALLLK